jgi:hypothetical protein
MVTTKAQRNRASEQRRTLHALLGKVDDLQRRGETDVEGALRRLNEISVDSVPGADYAGVTVVDDTRRVRSLGATHSVARVLDDVQAEVLEGPCLSAAWNQHTIVVDDLSVEDRWPLYRERALERTPVRSLLSFRLYADDGGDGLAALNFYAEDSGVFDDESVELGLMFAAHATMAWNLLRREQRFRSALASRDVIGQAKGVLMERFDIDAVAAFELLRRMSQESDTTVADIAQRLVARSGASG